MCVLYFKLKPRQIRDLSPTQPPSLLPTKRIKFRITRHPRSMRHRPRRPRRPKRRRKKIKAARQAAVYPTAPMTIRSRIPTTLTAKHRRVKIIKNSVFLLSPFFYISFNMALFSLPSQLLFLFNKKIFKKNDFFSKLDSSEIMRFVRCALIENVKPHIWRKSTSRILVHYLFGCIIRFCAEAARVCAISHFSLNRPDLSDSSCYLAISGLRN